MLVFLRGIILLRISLKGAMKLLSSLAGGLAGAMGAEIAEQGVPILLEDLLKALVKHDR